MFDKGKSKLQQTKRFGKVDVPAASELTLEKFNQLYSRMIEGAESIHALVLGATPELRDIVLENDHILTTVDHNEDAMHEKSEMMHFKYHPNETIVINDWMKLDFPDNTFDAILGDGVLTALSKDDQKTLLDNLHRMLKPTGHLLLREAAVIHNRPRYDPSVHVHEYRAGQYNVFDLFFGLRLYNHAFASIDVTTRKTYLNEFKQKLDEYVESGLLSVRERDQLRVVGEELEHTILHKEDLESLIRNTFHSRDIVHDVGSGFLSPWYFFLNQPAGQIELPDHVPTERQNYVHDYLASQTDSEE